MENATAVVTALAGKPALGADRMYLGAYLLANLGGNASPSAQDILKVLEAGGLDCDIENATAVVTALAGKTVAEVIAEGKVKLRQNEYVTKKRIYTRAEIHAAYEKLEWYRALRPEQVPTQWPRVGSRYHFGDGFSDSEDEDEDDFADLIREGILSHNADDEFERGGVASLDCDLENVAAVVTELAGKTVAEVIAEGKVKLASVPSGGSAAPAAAAPSGGSAPKVKQAVKKTGNSSNLEEMFKDRYTNKDERNAEMAEQGFEKVVDAQPRYPRRANLRRGSNNNAHRGGRGNSGSDGGRGGGRRGGYRAGDRKRRND